MIQENVEEGKADLGIHAPVCMSCECLRARSCVSVNIVCVCEKVLVAVPVGMHVCSGVGVRVICG